MQNRHCVVWRLMSSLGAEFTLCTDSESAVRKMPQDPMSSAYKSRHCGHESVGLRSLKKPLRRPMTVTVSPHPLPLLPDPCRCFANNVCSAPGSSAEAVMTVMTWLLREYPVGFLTEDASLNREVPIREVRSFRMRSENRFSPNDI